MNKLALAIFPTLNGIVGVILGAAAVFLVLYVYPFSHLTRYERVVPGFGAGKTVESFFLSGTLEEQGSIIALTHGELFPMDAIPPGIRHLDHLNLASGLAVMAWLHDESGKAVGFASELEQMHEDSQLLTGRLMTHTSWTLIIPGRGAIFLYQTENNFRLAKEIMLPMMIKGETWHGKFNSLNTFGPEPSGAGRIVGGTGEFEAISGEFIEVATLRGLTLGGRLDTIMELRIAYEE